MNHRVMPKRGPSMHAPNVRTSHRCSLPCVERMQRYSEALFVEPERPCHSLRPPHLFKNFSAGELRPCPKTANRNPGSGM